MVVQQLSFSQSEWQLFHKCPDQYDRNHVVHMEEQLRVPPVDHNEDAVELMMSQNYEDDVC